ncbi:MAG: rhomboid family intramembrane serine protease [Calditrichia bacterium]
MGITYNAPFVLTYALVAVSVIAYNTFVDPTVIPFYFTLQPYYSYEDPLFYFRLFSYAVGHGSWEHLIDNFIYLLLIGPYLEEKYGSQSVFSMALFTAVITSLLYLGFLVVAPNAQPSSIVGSSGIVFMMILLGSFTNVRSGHIPLTFIFIMLFFMGTQVINAFDDNQISEFAHIVGGICGSFFGFVKNKKS